MSTNWLVSKFEWDLVGWLRLVGWVGSGLNSSQVGKVLTSPIWLVARVFLIWLGVLSLKVVVRAPN